MSTEQSEFDFDDLKTREIPVKYKGKKFVLREASSEAARLYRNASMRGASMSREQSRFTVPDSVGDAETVLVAQCLFEIYGDPPRERLWTLSQVRTIEARVMRPLFDWVKENSDLEERSSPAAPQKTEAELVAIKDNHLGK